MSEEQLKAFLAKVQDDPSLKAQLQAKGSDAIAIAKAAGFTIVEADKLALTDAELESLSGGASAYCTSCDPNHCQGSEMYTCD